MKSEERHELETNVLAKFLADFGQKYGRYGTHALFAVIALLAVVAIWQVSSNAMRSGATQAWDSVASAMVQFPPDVETLSATSDTYAGKTAGDAAKLAAADIKLAQATLAFFTNKSEAMEQIGEAREAYESLVSGGSEDLFRQRARFGLARVQEIEGDIPGAIATYGEVTGLLAEMAKERAEDLEELGAASYASWLREAEGTARRDPLDLFNSPEFGADPLGLPSEGGTPQAPMGEDELQQFRDFMDKLPAGPGEDRYTPPGETGEEGAGADAPLLPPLDSPTPPDVELPESLDLSPSEPAAEPAPSDDAAPETNEASEGAAEEAPQGDTPSTPPGE